MIFDHVDLMNLMNTANGFPYSPDIATHVGGYMSSRFPPLESCDPC